MTSNRRDTGPAVRPGTVVGPYRIEKVIAEGGMGVIYRAFDTKLARPVAMKFLSNELADEDARRRFQREAQLASSLNHPHILTTYDTGECGGRQYLVMEWVDGGTLRDWAAQTRRSWQQIVETLIGVADGLAAAHDAGILHRDVKPENILVANNGYAKLADFGVAKLANGTARAVGAAVTRRETVIGSPGYMSPEQRTGGPVDARSDIFAFGVMLYELLDGHRPFTGANESEVARAVMLSPPPPLPGEIPVALRMIVEKALEKDPADRYQTMRDLVVDLRRIARRRPETLGEAPAQRAAPRPGRRVRAASLAIVAVTAAAVAGWAGRAWLADTEPLGTALPTGSYRVTDFVGIEEMPAASPDGKTVAFTVAAQGRRQIWLRLLAGGAPLQITHGDADHDHPRWAPDSSALIYFVPAEDDTGIGTLWEVAALGGAARRIAPSLGGADLSHDGRHIAAFQRDNGEVVLAILRRDGSRVEAVKRLLRSVEYSTPRWSPDDRSIAFVANEGGFNRKIYLVDLSGGEPRTLTGANDIHGLTWLPDGAGLVYASSEGTVLSYPPVFNLRTVSRRDGVDRQLTVGGDVSYVEPDMVQPGKLFASRVRMQSDIWRFPISDSPADAVARAVPVTHQTGQVQTPSVSPDGQEIVYLSDSGGHSNVWLARLDGSETRQITFERDPGVLIGIPVWAPAADRIVFIRTEDGVNTEWLVNRDGGGLRPLVKGVAANWSWDGQWLYFANMNLEHECIGKIAIERDSSVRVRCGGANPVISVDGSTLYFSPSVTRQNELMKATPEDGPAQPLASYARSRNPSWPTGYALSPDGRWLAVPLKDAGTTNIWAIPTDGGPFRQITDFGNRPTLIARQVSWSPDGASIYAAVVESDADIVLFDDAPR